MARPPLRHGTRSCYVQGCRKPECVKANREYQRKWVTAKREKAKAKST